MLNGLISDELSESISRAATAGVIMFSLGYVIIGQDIRTDAIYPILVDVAYLVVLYALVVRSKSFHQTEQLIMAASIVLWSTFLIFFVPYNSPSIVLSVFLVLLISMFFRAGASLVAALILVVAVELSYIVAGEHNWSGFIFLSVHSMSLILTAFVSDWFTGKMHRQSEQLLDEKEKVGVERQRLQALINSMTDGVLATDTEGRVAVYNGSALDIMNINASLDGMLVTDFLKVRDADENIVDVLKLAQERQGYLVSRDYIMKIDEYENINLYISISPVRIGFGHSDTEGYIMLLRDITREKSLEEERDEFISVVSHELRTPITIAEGNISNAELVAEKEKLPSAVAESLDAAHKQVVFLSDMINDLSTLSRAERGKLKEAPEDIDIHELIMSLQRDYRAQAQQKSLEFKTHVDKEVTTIFSSRLYLREILQNFITNAIKYTQEGDVELSVRVKNGKVEFSVRDSGIGISKTDQKHLFKKFFRSEDYRTRENNGTGLGLYVTMKLAKLIHAQIAVKSELNKGSTFIITVPSLKGHKVEVI